MKSIKSICLTVALLLGLQGAVSAQSNGAAAKFKKYVNDVVQKVEQTDDAGKKRQILNDSMDDLMEAFDRVSAMKSVSQADREAIASLRADLSDKKNELNGRKGYARVPDGQLNAFAQYLQQDLEQADEQITISVTVLLLIVIILLLL